MKTIFLSLMLPLVACGAVRAAQPNFVIILIDDMGWADSSTYGSEYYQTPNLTRLAEEGMLFTDAYAAAPLCSPTRASIMSGLHPARLRMTQAIVPSAVSDPKALPPRKNEYVGRVQNRDHMDLDITTLAEALKLGGYHTAHIGKWHLGPIDREWSSEDHTYNAEHQGFDFVIGGAHLPGPPDYYSPYSDGRPGYTIRNLEPGPEGEYLNERLAEESIKWISSVKDSGKPFYLNFWHYAIHGPVVAKKDLLPKYIESRDPDAGQRCPEFATMIESMDTSIGMLLDWLDRPENAELKANTFILLSSDNGAVIHNEVNGNPWSANRPLRGGKANIYEGGSRVPWIVRWRDTPAGTECNTPVVSTDIYPTVLDLAGLEPNTELDGRSIAPLLNGESQKTEPVFVHFPHDMGMLNAASSFVRDDGWKLIRYYWAAGPDHHHYELFNLRDDPQEAVNLAGHYPGKVRALDALLEAFLQETGALTPLPNPDYAGTEFPPPRKSRNSTLSKASRRPETLKLALEKFQPLENGSRIIQLMDEKGVKRKSTAVIYKGADWISVENRPDGSVKVSWDVAKKNGPAEILFGWCGGSTATEVDDWTLGPYKMVIQ
ncbi:sulfatase [Pontiella desulfatans]|nr:sulfatase [Pontiella desulfatans]